LIARVARRLLDDSGGDDDEAAATACLALRALYQAARS
jgi:hypothetical protein